MKNQFWAELFLQYERTFYRDNFALIPNLNTFIVRNQIIFYWCFSNSSYFMEHNTAIGVDIGGSHISCAAVDLVSYKVHKDTVTEKQVDNKGSAGEIVGVWAKALSEVMKKVGKDQLKGIGFGMPGPFDYVKGISYIKGVAKYENLYGCNVKNEIAGILGVTEEFPIRFMNDVSSFAVGEALVGKAAKVTRSMAVTLGTGFGSAFIDNRIPIVDGPEVPKLGCVYHLPYKDNIADDYFSTRWFLGSYKKLTGKQLSGVKEIADLYDTDKTVRDLFTEFGNNLGSFLAPWLIRFRAEIVVVGGNISHAYNLFGDIFENSLRKEGCSCKVALSELKEDAAFLGAAYLLDNEFWKAVQHALPLM
ncbi:MAG: ROK family protein [Bacteroidales bacterium]|nr:ROK family protein [Bacteroidales bacterium]